MYDSIKKKNHFWITALLQEQNKKKLQEAAGT